MEGLDPFTTEDVELFFIYDREAVKSEYDSPEIAVLYLYPPAVKVEDQCMLCGQLVGMISFAEAITGSLPCIFKTRRGKFCLKVLGKYLFHVEIKYCFNSYNDMSNQWDMPNAKRVLKGQTVVLTVRSPFKCLGGKLEDDDGFLIRTLQKIISVFQFYHGSLEHIMKVCNYRQEDFAHYLAKIFECFLPFCLHYGDPLLSVLDPLPFVSFDKMSAYICVKGMQILEMCQRREYVLSGCLLCCGSIVCSQVSPELTSNLLLIRPNQRNFPADVVDTGIELPYGVRTVPVYLTEKEYNALIASSERSPYGIEKSDPVNQSYIRRKSRRLTEMFETPDERVRSTSEPPSLLRVRGVYNREISFLAEKSGNLLCKPQSDRMKLMFDESGDSPTTSSSLTDGSMSRSPARTLSISPVMHESGISITSPGNALSSFTSCNGDGIPGNREGIASNDCEESSERVLTSAARCSSAESGFHCTCKPYPCFVVQTVDNAVGSASSVSDFYVPKDMESSHCLQNHANTSEHGLPHHLSQDYGDEGGTIEKTDKVSLIFSTVINGGIEFHVDSKNGTPGRPKSCLYNDGSSTEGPPCAFDTDYSSAEAIPCEFKDNDGKGCIECSPADHHGDMNTCANPDTSPPSVVNITLTDKLNGSPQTSVSLSENEVGTNHRTLVPSVEDLTHHVMEQSSSIKYVGTSEESNSTGIDAKIVDVDNSNIAIKFDSNFSAFESSWDIGRNQLDLTRAEERIMGGNGELITPFCGQDSPTYCTASNKIRQNGFVSLQRNGSSGSSVKSVSEVSGRSTPDEGQYCSPTQQDATNQKRQESGYMSDDRLHDNKMSRTISKLVDSKHVTSSLPFIPHKDTEKESDELDSTDVDGLCVLHLYVQAHSDTVLALFMKPRDEYQPEKLKAIWESTLPHLGDIEALITSYLDSTEQKGKDLTDYAYIRHSRSSRKLEGNLKTVIHPKDSAFVHSVQQLHEQFINSPSLKDCVLRNYTSAVYGRQCAGEETYFQQRGTYKPGQGPPTPYDVACVLDQRAQNRLRKDKVLGVLL